MLQASKKIVQVVLFVAAGVVLGVSLNKGCINPALADHALRAVVVIGAALLLGSLPGGRARVRDRVAAALFESSERAFNGLLFVAGVTTYSLVSWNVFQAVPHLDDSVAALFHARIFASGHLTLPLPAQPEFFAMTGMIDSRHGLDHLASMYPLGFPGVFVPGVLLGVPWITNPVLGAILVVLIGQLGRELYDAYTGRLAALLALGSPFIVLQAGTYLSHIPTACFLVLCMWSVCRLLKTGAMKYGFLAGLGFGVAFLCRPLTALVTGVIIALAPLVAWRQSLRYWKPVALAGFLALLAAGALAGFQQVTTGDYRTPGHEIGLGERGRMGFGRLDKSVSHSPEQGWDYTRLRMTVLNHKLLGWPVPAFLVALLPFFLFRAGGKEVWLLLPTLALLLVYWTFWYYEWFYEARYIFSGVPMLLVLSARGYVCLKDALGRSARFTRPVLLSCVAFQLCVYLPHYLGSFTDHHGDVEAVLPRVVESQGITNAVIFMGGLGYLPEGSSNNPKNSFYGTGFIRNSLSFDGDVVYARYIRRRNYLLAREFPHKTYYLYRYHRPSNRAVLYRLEFDGKQEVKHLVEPSPGTPFLMNEDEL